MSHPPFERNHPMSRSRSTTESTTEVEAPVEAAAVKTRARKSHAEHASAAVQVQVHRIDRQHEKIKAAVAELEAAQGLLPDLTARLVYLASNPDLPTSVLLQLQADGYLPGVS